MLAQRFMALFAGLGRAHGTYLIGAGTRSDAKGKVKGQAITRQEPVTEALWAAHLAGEGAGLGIVPIREDSTCHFGAIDIDDYSISLPEIEAKVAALKLPLVPCRTKSGGCHLYLFATEPVPAGDLRGALVEWAAALGFPGVEVFPKQVVMAGPGDIGNWINMPYFDAGRTTRYAIRDGKSVDAETFLSLARSHAVSLEGLRAIAVVPAIGLEDGPPCLQFLAREGFGEGGRNNALFNLGVYCRLRHDADPQWLAGGEDWTAAVLRMNDQFLSPPLERREVKEILHSLRRKNYFYLCNQPPISACCAKDLCRQRRYGIGHGRGDTEAVETFRVENPRRMLTDPGAWVGTIEGHDLELTPDDLMDPVRFQKKMIEKLKKVPPPLSRKGWRAILVAVVDEAHDVEAPEDAGSEGRMFQMLEDFCTNHAEAKALDEILLGRPFTKDARTLFRGKDFMRYLDQHHFRSMKEREVWAVLHRRGAEHTKIKLKGKLIVCWSVKAFDRQDEDFDPVAVSDGVPF